MTTIFGAQGVSPTLRGQPTNVLNLQPGETWLVPAGTWDAQLDGYSTVQQYDAIQGAWRSIGGDNSAFRYVNSDGVNYRLANQTGCVVGALLTNKGSGYTSAPTVTDNGGGGTVYQAILGPVISTAVTVNNGGKNYTYPPLVFISAPASPGIQATGYATIVSGAVTAVTITDQGGGYNSTPVISLINDPRDTTGAGAVATATTTGSGTIAGVVVVDHGIPFTSTGVVPTISFSSGSAAATAIVCTTITGYTVTSAGSGYVGTVEVSALGGFPSTAAAYTNPHVQSNLVRTRQAVILAAISGGTISSTGYTVLDGGIYTSVTPTQIIYGSIIGAGTLAVGNVGFTFGGVASTVSLYAV